MTLPEPWLRGPLDDFSRWTTPAAHALLQSREDLERVVAELTVEELWRNPGGAPSVGFHLRHIAGSIDRLLAYAAGRALTDEQFRDLAAEAISGEPPAEARQLVAAAQAKIIETLAVIRATPGEQLFEARAVGRAQLPTNVFGLLFHIAEHTQRHTGSIIATAKIVRGINESQHRS